jgi:hypothetical protein
MSLIDQSVMMKANRTRTIFRCIPRRYRAYLFIILIICSCIFFLHPIHFLKNKYVESIDNFDLFDDDDMPFKCPWNIEFRRENRQHLAIIIAAKLFPFVWINFRALLCSGIDAYVMLDEHFLIGSSSRADGFQSRTNRSRRSYSRRFLYVTNRQLELFGVKYMKRLPSVQYSAWDRVIVWLYQRENLKNAWIIEHDVQWYDVRNLTYLFDRFANDTTDLLCDNIVPTGSYWVLWPKTESDIFPKSKWIGTFSPLVRWSRRLLQYHYRYMQLIHINRLHYEFNRDYRFQEFIMGTIAKIENLTVEVYSTNYSFIHIILGDMSDMQILTHLRNGRYILHPVKHESILTKHSAQDLVPMIQMTGPQMPYMNFIEKRKNRTM